MSESLPSADYDAGLEGRYYVKRLNDAAHKHDDCRYFVLDPQHDPIAESVLRAYAVRARREGFLALADDIEAWVGDCFEGMRPHAAHSWTDIGIAGETLATCPGRPRVIPPAGTDA